MIAARGVVVAAPTTENDLGKVTAAWLAALEPSAYLDGFAQTLAQMIWNQPDAKRGFLDTCERLGAWKVLRAAARRADRQTMVATGLDMELVIRGSDVYLGERRLGQVVRLYRTVTPQEAQARIAHETFIARFLAWLERESKVVTLATTDAVVTFFVPEGRSIPDIPAQWQRFVEVAFSTEQLLQTFVLLVNSVQLTERGLSVPEVPVVSEAQANVLAAFVFAAARDIKRRLLHYERQIAMGAKDAETMEAKLAKQRSNYGQALTAMDRLLSDWQARDEVRARMLRTLAGAYTVTATRQLKSTKAIVAKFVTYAASLLDTPPEEYLTIIPLVSSTPPQLELRTAGDASNDFCYACGRVLRKPRRGTRATTYIANKLIIQKPSQTLQRRLTETRPVVCPTCAALSVVSPIKMADQALVVSLRERTTDGERGGLAQARYLFEHRLRMLTAGELSLVAGRYVLLPSNERTPNGKSLRQQMGGKEYALLKLASLFPADVFERFVAEACLGADPVVLLPRHLVALCYLVEVFGILPDRLGQDKALYSSTADAVRYVEQDGLIHAIYRLLTGVPRKGHYDYKEAQLTKLEDCREVFAEVLKMDEQTKIERRFRDIAGLTGILYAFALRVRSDLRKQQPSMATSANAAAPAQTLTRSSKDPDREVKKLLEQVDNPNRFTYEAASNLSGQSARLWRTQATHFIYDEAARLLTEVGLDTVERTTSESNGQVALELWFDDIGAIYTLLYEQHYTNEKARRDFAYELKLSLYSRFPDLLSPADRRAS